MGTYPSTLVYTMLTYETQCTNTHREMWMERQVGERGAELFALFVHCYFTQSLGACCLEIMKSLLNPSEYSLKNSNNKSITFYIEIIKARANQFLKFNFTLIGLVRFC